MYKLILALVISFIFILSQTILSQVSWIQTSGPQGGDMRCVVVAPSGQIFAGSNGAGIFRSLDQGENWSQINTGILNLNVRKIALNSSGHIFAGKLDVSGSGILRSTNNGVNWSYTALTNADISAIALNSSGHIFAGTDTNGIYRSTDNGVSFTQINNGLTYGIITSIAIKTTGEALASTLNGGIFISTNNGNNWVPVNSGLPITNKCNTIAINPVNGYLFAGTGNASYGGAVYRSTNNGGIWTIMGLTSQWVRGIKIDQTGYIYAAGNVSGGSGEYISVFRSTNGGATFEGGPTIFNYFLNYTSIDLNYASGNLFVSTSAGIYKSLLISGILDFKSDGITGQNIRALFRTNTGNSILAGSTFWGVSRTTNGGGNWQYNSYDECNVNSFAVNSFGFIFAGVYTPHTGFGYFRLMRSTDNGETFEGFSPYTSWPSVQSLAINNLDYIYAGTAGNGIYRSFDNGANWTQAAFGNGYVYSIITNSSGVLFAGTGAGKIFRSTDNGLIWDQVYTNSNPNNNIRFLVFKSLNNIYAGLDSGGIVFSTNNGANWAQSGFTISKVKAIAFNTEGYIFAGTENNGLYLSTNNGNNWVQNNSGLTNTTVNALIFDDNGYLYCGTGGGSVFRSSQPIGIQNISTEIPASYSLHQNYPNPFNPVTKIKFEIPLSRGVSEGRGVLTQLIIYDVLGREITTLVNEQLQPGTYKVDFDGTSYPSGVYFYKLTTGSFTAVNKMVLLK